MSKAGQAIEPVDFFAKNGLMIKVISVISLLFLLTGCPFTAQTVMPLESQVVDAETGLPIEMATVLRIVCDIHDRRCTKGKIEKGETDKDGKIKFQGKRQWGLWLPLPGCLPVPNHQIAIWKPGYRAFVFSQYGNIEDLLSSAIREDVKSAIRAIPKDRNNYTPDDTPEKLFQHGIIKLQKI
jgi:hypothetical protein